MHHCAETTAFLTDLSIYGLYWVQQKKVIERDWEDKMKVAQRTQWRYRTSKDVAHACPTAQTHTKTLEHLKKLLWCTVPLSPTVFPLKPCKILMVSSCSNGPQRTILFWILTLLYGSICQLYTILFIANVREVHDLQLCCSVALCDIGIIQS